MTLVRQWDRLDDEGLVTGNYTHQQSVGWWLESSQLHRGSVSSAKVCLLPRDYGGQSRQRTGAKKSIRMSEFYGERGGQASH